MLSDTLLFNMEKIRVERPIKDSYSTADGSGFIFSSAGKTAHFTTSAETTYGFLPCLIWLDLTKTTLCLIQILEIVKDPS